MYKLKKVSYLIFFLGFVLHLAFFFLLTQNLFLQGFLKLPLWIKGWQTAGLLRLI